MFSRSKYLARSKSLPLAASVWGSSLILLLAFAGGSIGQTQPSPRVRKPVRPEPLTPREIARKTLPSVVLLIGQDANGKAVTLGSGFFVQPDVIATNYHVIEYASRAYAMRKTFEEKFRILGTLEIDEENDLALLKMGEPLNSADPYLAPLPATPLHLATENRVEVGEEVYVVGNPEGLEGTFSQGIVSALRGSNYIQITAAISHGSSGGPVLNANGDVIGVATSTIEEGQNLNFAIPITKLRLMLKNSSTVSPLEPHFRLRSDGLYSTKSTSPQDPGDMPPVYHYLRFYSDGTLFWVYAEQSSEEIFAWTERGQYAFGKYKTAGRRIEFTGPCRSPIVVSLPPVTTGGYHPLPPEDTCVKSGTVDRDTILLLNGNGGKTVEYRFLRFGRRD